MSSILAKASQLKAEIRLAQAVSQFEAELSNDHKTVFRNYRSQSLDSPPTPGDVMRLTAEIDRRLSEKVRGRCFGPRFTNFLQVVQQFAALGDVVVGGSQNIIACGVWSLSMGNFLSYLEKLSTLFMKIGCTASRYQNMALLYPRSKSLQSHLFEYFIVVVRLCHQLLKFTQKSLVQKVASALSDSDIKAFQSDLDHWASSIKEEISLLMAKRIQEEAEENSQFRAVSSKFFKSAPYEKRLATNLRVLDICSKYDYETTWKQTRKIGNANFFCRDPKYQEWKAQVKSCTLIYTGKLGSGKSVMLANIVDDLSTHVQSKNIAVAYFFCRHDVPESLKAQTVVRSLARQLLRTIPDLTTIAKFCDETRTVLGFGTILRCLRRAFPPDYQAYFVLDGLDECDCSEREILAQQLRELQEALTLLLCVSFRAEPNSALELSSGRFTAAEIASIPDENPEIEAYIEAELENRLVSRALVIGQPSLILEIRDALLKGYQGMFLWVALQIRTLSAIKTDQGIRNALATLPKDLPETYSRILRRSEGPGDSYQILILQLIMAASRPLTTDEFREALSVVPGDAVWNPSRLINDVYSTLACCGCLLTVDEEESTVRFVHHSVRQFLLCGFRDSTNTPFTIDGAQRTIADIVITYLSYGVFGTELSTMKVREMAIGSAPSGIIRSTLDSSSHAQNLALKLLRPNKQVSVNISNILAKARKPFQPCWVNEFHFYSYAKAYWLRHILYASGQRPDIYDLLLRLSKRNVLGVANATAEDVWRPVIWAVQNGNEIVVKLLLETGKIDINAKNTCGQTLFWRATSGGHEVVVKLLLETGKVNVEAKDNSGGQTPLWRAASTGYDAVVKLLLETGKVDVDAKDTYEQTPL
ncbi:uncharacterized protein BDR25DRAFT_291179 [Lindgomyces ingoldianus]|uniref:Uncharacterized protein n=1 Tax=Lindgomyces ingoldianus TaxID=673940 RepID=A0ACB6QLI6_9PLEO|nr:uncharacterized protein BDR25DRAFT_291179 [Lindgomyces ingoldianus]KAF2467808.1 hypothetical protein BDR25DRAFT_291179 [Lindgomyces ingoldianus]